MIFSLTFMYLDLFIKIWNYIRIFMKKVNKFDFEASHFTIFKNACQDSLGSYRFY